jgi:hypothetical protein
MKTLLLILIAAALMGCKSTERPGHNWRPPGMLMQAPKEVGRL